MVTWCALMQEPIDLQSDADVEMEMFLREERAAGTLGTGLEHRQR